MHKQIRPFTNMYLLMRTRRYALVYNSLPCAALIILVISVGLVDEEVMFQMARLNH
jgi:hypothetical protein